MLHPRLICVALGVWVGALGGIASGAGPETSAPAAVEVCERLPTAGTLQSGASASSQEHLARRIRWTAGSAGQPFTWVARRGGVVIVGGATHMGGVAVVPVGSYRVTVTNRGTVGQWWRVCWSI